MSGVKPSQTAERGWCGPERSDYPVPLCACLGLDGKGVQPPDLPRAQAARGGTELAEASKLPGIFQIERSRADVPAVAPKVES